ncbi:MAG TPA: L,D-transpeptidase family protein [Nocardioidaceae bacterium]|nr:L,D-transpeptidase family protein [Nocardioidaceae bacterium]
MPPHLTRVLFPTALLLALLVAPDGVADARVDFGGPVVGSHAVAVLPPTRSSPPPSAEPRAAAVARAVPAPAFASRVPARTHQVIRTVRSRRWCAHRWCTITQAWRKGAHGRWKQVRSFRSTIGPNGFGKTREGDLRSPSGVYRVKAIFSTRRRAPGPMPWRRRLPTSNVTNSHSRLYNTWIEQPGRTDGDRPSMRYGFVVDYNNVRLRPGVGPRPVLGKGSGILYHTSRRGERWVATLGCTQVGNPHSMRWIVRWLNPKAHPRVVQDL